MRFWAGGHRRALDHARRGDLRAASARTSGVTAELSIFGGGTALYSLVYPALAGLPLVAFGLDHGYTVLKAIQALVMSLTAVPVYLWGGA